MPARQRLGLGLDLLSRQLLRSVENALKGLGAFRGFNGLGVLGV